MARDINAEIERLTAERQEMWSAGINGDAVKLIAAKLDALYEEKRAAGAEHGTPAAHDRAVKRANAEKELDRLMQA